MRELGSDGKGGGYVPTEKEQIPTKALRVPEVSAGAKAAAASLTTAWVPPSPGALWTPQGPVSPPNTESKSAGAAQQPLPVAKSTPDSRAPSSGDLSSDKATKDSTAADTGAALPAPDPTRKPTPNLQSALFNGGDVKVLFGENCAPVRMPEPLPPIGPVFHFRVLKKRQSVHKGPDAAAPEVGARIEGEYVRGVDFRGSWVRLAPETEKHVEENWEAWMLTEDEEGPLLEEITEPEESTKVYTKNLMKKVWQVHDHILRRMRERGDRVDQYLRIGRVPPGKHETLPEGTRCISAFWGIEARYVRLGPGEEYWPQGCIDLHTSEIAQRGHWRVFAARNFGKHELVEVCPLIEVPLDVAVHSMPLRCNLLETPMSEDGGKKGYVKIQIPLGWGMMYQHGQIVEGVEVNEEQVEDFNVKMIPSRGHMYIYTMREIQADEELKIEFKRCTRTDTGDSIDLTGFTPYWSRGSGNHPEVFAKALTTPVGPRPVRPVPGMVKYGKSKLHNRGVFADANFKKGEIIEICPVLILDDQGMMAVPDNAILFHPMKIVNENSTIIKREKTCVLPLGYGGMHNHLPKGKGANVSFWYDETTLCVMWIAEQDIKRNEELCLDYGEEYWTCSGRAIEYNELKCREPEWVDLLDYLADKNKRKAK